MNRKETHAGRFRSISDATPDGKMTGISSLQRNSSILRPGRLSILGGQSRGPPEADLGGPMKPAITIVVLALLAGCNPAHADGEQSPLPKKVNIKVFQYELEWVENVVFQNVTQFGITDKFVVVSGTTDEERKTMFFKLSSVLQVTTWD